MTFDWNEYFKLAQELSQRKDGTDPQREARLRSAISRSYYSVFCSARNHLNKKKVPLPKENIHASVKDQYRNSSDTTLRQIGNNLERLRIDRNKADYDDSFDRLNNTAVLHLMMAGMTIEDLAKLK